MYSRRNSQTAEEAWAMTPVDDWAADVIFTTSTPALESDFGRLDEEPVEDVFAPEPSGPSGPLSPAPLNEESPHSAFYTCPVSQECSLWYFAIGSMINPTSLSLRKLTPLESYPGILRGWRLVFRGDCGMASILPADSTLPSMLNHSQPRTDFHGVLHRLSKEQMTKLDVIENSYERLEVYVECYDGHFQKAIVYKMCELKLDPSKPDALPSERYIDIISRGCAHFGIHREYIAWLRAHACVKRKAPADYRRIPIHELHQSGLKHLQMTAEELTRFDGRPIEEGEILDEGDESILSVSPTPLGSPSLAPSPSPDQPDLLSSSDIGLAASTSPPTSASPVRFYPLRIAVNKKILEWIGDLRQPLLANTYEFMRCNFGGTDCSFSYTCVFFEPLYPIVSRYEDMSLEHRAMVEDIFYWKCYDPAEHMREWKLVGFLSNEEQRSSQQVGRQKLRQNRMGRQAADGASADEPDFASNMFLSLSMEDHSGASSTCFAYCCAGAQPFHAQRVRDQRRSAAGAYGGSGSAHHTHSRTPNHRVVQQAERERKRRHSIGNVGLHAVAALAAASAVSSSSGAPSSITSSVFLGNFYDSASHSPTSSNGSAFACPASAPHRMRASSVCSGVLASSHTNEDEDGANVCTSRRSLRLDSVEDCLTSPPPTRACALSSPPIPM